MKVIPYDGEILILRRRLDEMWEAAGDSPAPARQLMEEALEEVSVTLEELRTTGEIVQQQNQELGSANRSLREQEQRYHELFEFAPDAYITTNLEGVVQEANRASLLLLGVRRLEFLIGTPMAIYVAEHERKGFRQQLAQMKAEGPEMVTSWPLRIEPKLGAPFDAEVTVAIARETSGWRVGFRWIMRDVTERKKFEESLQETSWRLEEALRSLRSAQEKTVEQERLRALGQMASGVAHDFNNALSGILGFTEVLLDRQENLDDKDRVRRYLKLINTGAKDAARVVARLREFYRHRKQDDVFLPVDMNRVVTDAIAYTQPRWKDQMQARGVAIDVVSKLERTPPVPGDESELRDILTNLIFNAVDAMPEGGTLEVSTHLEGQTVVLQVRDSGVGMTEEVRKSCLEPFFTTKGESGTGLGLAMVYGTLSRHDGTIDIRSVAGRGTTVIVHLPVYTCDRGPNRNRLPVVEKPLPPILKVLVVEDLPDVRALLVQYLVGDGHQVELASNGRVALDLFKAGSFDLVITDRAMPEMNGDQLTSAIKGIAPKEPVIMLTGFGDFMSAADRPEGVDHVLSKPVTLEALREALARVARTDSSRS
ncbi:MAG: ATP-binding protein [Thermoanaerobaculia bacterium]